MRLPLGQIGRGAVAKAHAPLTEVALALLLA